MLPVNVLSSIPMPEAFVGARALEVTSIVDYEDGGVALNNPSLGLMYQVWTGRLVGYSFILSAPEVEATTIYSAPGISEISFTFDQNMNPALAFVQAGTAKLRWYDTTIPDWSIIELPGCINPRVAMDDKRSMQSSANDIILAYINASGALCYRQQRDRFTIERVLTAGPCEGLIKIGMSVNLRFQFLVGPVESRRTNQPLIWVVM